MATTITEIDISTNEKEEEKLSAEGFQMVPGNLNCGSYGPNVFLWYKREEGAAAVTRIQFSFMEEMRSGLMASGFTEVYKKINPGNSGGVINLWYIQGTTQYDFPITDLKVTTCLEDEVGLVRDGWERLGCDLKRGTHGDWVYIWVKREEKIFISNITASINFSEDVALLKDGYFRMDEDTNRGADPHRSSVFLWIRHSKTGPGITAIQVPEDDLKPKGFKRLNVNLNNGTNGPPVYLWYMEDPSPTIHFFTLLVGARAQTAYEDQGIRVESHSVNNGTNGVPLYVSYW